MEYRCNSNDRILTETVLSIIFILLFLSGCTESNNEMKDKRFIAFFVKSQIPVVNQNLGISYNFDSAVFIRSGKYSILKYSIGEMIEVIDSSIKSINSDTVHTTFKISNKKDFEYFVYNNNLKSGIVYNSLLKQKSFFLDSDSMILKKVTKLTISPGALRENWVNINTSINSNIETKTYIAKKEKGFEKNDTLKFFYSNDFENIDFELLKSITYPKKLFKVLINSDNEYDNNNTLIYPSNQIIVELGLVSLQVHERNNVNSLLIKFQKKKL